jgi:ABC-type branched-subunit amino acid transport system substrate-binding protein
MADEGAQGYGSVVSLKVGLLIDYPSNAATTDDTLDALRLVLDEAFESRLVDRPIELVIREVIGLPNGSYKAVERAYDELVDAGCLVVFGPYVSDNVVPLRAHVERTAEVAIITLAGSEGALGEWCFALNNGSMAEEPVMLAAILRLDGHSRIAIAHESSLIGKEYLGFVERAFEEAGLQIVGSVAIPQVESDKVDAVSALRTTMPDTVVHVGFGHGLWGFNDALAKVDWNPPRYTTTAFELAHIDPAWMVQLAGWIGLDSYDERNAVGQEFLDRFAARYGRRPNYFMPGLCHDVATVITRALAGARPLTGPGVKDAMEGVKFVPAASGAPGTCLQFGRYNRQGWMGVDYLVARRVLPDASAHVFHAAPSAGLAKLSTATTAV